MGKKCCRLRKLEQMQDGKDTGVCSGSLMGKEEGGKRCVETRSDSCMALLGHGKDLEFENYYGVLIRRMTQAIYIFKRLLCWVESRLEGGPETRGRLSDGI